MVKTSPQFRWQYLAFFGACDNITTRARYRIARYRILGRDFFDNRFLRTFNTAQTNHATAILQCPWNRTLFSIKAIIAKARGTL